MRPALFVIAAALTLTTISLTAGVAAAQDAEAEPAQFECRPVGEGHFECSGPGAIIYGRRQRPGAFYVLNRSRSLYELPAVRRDLVREVRRAVRRRPF